jgi:hypothetical protein
LHTVVWRFNHRCPNAQEKEIKHMSLLQAIIVLVVFVGWIVAWLHDVYQKSQFYSEYDRRHEKDVHNG